MNSKNIKKSLNGVLKNWIACVDDEAVSSAIRDNAIVTGGAIVSMLTGEAVNDYDVYFRTKDSLLRVASYYVSKFNEAHPETLAQLEEKKDGKVVIFIRNKGVSGEKEVNDSSSDDNMEITNEENDAELNAVALEEKPKYRPVFLTSNAITLSNKIQIVIRFYGDVEEIHKNYDFAHCTCAWSAWDNNLALPQKALECIINKELYYSGSKYPLCSIIRTRKYLKRGYTISAGQYLKMCLQLNELNLHDIEVLKDQLVGVDSAYFEMAIAAFQKKKEEEPEWIVDNSYLFEVINRIF